MLINLQNYLHLRSANIADFVKDDPNLRLNLTQISNFKSKEYHHVVKYVKEEVSKLKF